MEILVERVDVWAASIKDEPGALAQMLNALRDAGADLDFVLARRVCGDTWERRGVSDSAARRCRDCRGDYARFQRHSTSPFGARGGQERARHRRQNRRQTRRRRESTCEVFRRRSSAHDSSSTSDSIPMRMPSTPWRRYRRTRTDC